MSDTQGAARILICEYEVLVAADLESRLRGLGYTVCGKADSGEKALELVEQQQPDLVMLDIFLKGEMDGADTAKVIRDEWGIPVVFLTPSLIACSRLTFPFGYILKPFGDRDLQTITEMALNVAEMDAERRHAEAALSREKEMLSRTESIAHIGSWEWEIARDKVVWSKELFRIFQMKPSSTAPSWIEQTNLYHPDDFGLLKDAVEKAIVDGTPYELELRAIRKDGEIRLCDARGFPEKDTNGQVQRLFGFLQDITERKEAEKKRRESERQYRELIQKTQAAIVVHGPDTRIITCNSKSQEILGLTEDQMLGRGTIHPGWKFFDATGENLDISDYPVNQVLATQQPLRDFTGGIYRPRTDDIVWVLVNADPVFDCEHNLQQVIVTFVDITARKKAEEALTKSEAFLNVTGRMAKVGGWEIDAGTHDANLTERTPGFHTACARTVWRHFIQS